MPPTPLPQVVMPIASERRLLKYVDTMATAGQKRQPLSIPTQTPCARNICQYFVHADVVNVPVTVRIAPEIDSGRKNPASVRRPVKVPMKKRRKTLMDPIQEMSDGARSRALT